MKINMYGGALTISYSLAKFLRRKGQDVTLFLDRQASDKSYDPIWEDEDLKSGYPEWIKTTDAKFSRTILGDKRSIDFARALSDCDILHLHGEAYLWANIINKPFIYQSHGYDLDQLPFNVRSVKQIILSIFAKRAIRRSYKAIVIPHQRTFLKMLGIAEKEIYLPFPMDLDKYKPTDAKGLRESILSAHNASLIFFHPTRHEWVNNASTNNKGNDKVLRAFAVFTKRSSRKAVLMLVNKGRNVAESKKLIDSLGISENILWLEAEPKARLIERYSASDIVLDQFTLGNFGQIFLEAMACAKPTFAYLKGYEETYPEVPPAVNVFTVDDIANNLIDLSDNKEKLEGIGQKSRAWVKKYHGWDHACDGLIELYGKFIKENSKC